MQVRKAGLRAIFVFVAPPSVEELEKRLRGRGTEKEEQVQQRLTNAKQEIARSHVPPPHCIHLGISHLQPVSCVVSTSRRTG